MPQNITADDRRRKQAIFCWVIISISMYFRLLQNRNILYDVKFLKIFSGYPFIDLYMCLCCLICSYIYLIIGGGLGVTVYAGKY